MMIVRTIISNISSILGALLGVRGHEKHEREMAENGIEPVDLVVMNLYALEATVASGAAFDTCVENIDIGVRLCFVRRPKIMRTSQFSRHHSSMNR